VRNTENSGTEIPVPLLATLVIMPYRMWRVIFHRVYIFMGFKKLYNTNSQHSYRPCVDAVRTYRNVRMGVGCV